MINKISYLFLTMFVLLSLMIPSLASAAPAEPVGTMLSQTEVDAILSKSSSVTSKKMRAATEDEYKKISQKAQRMKKEHPNKEVDVQKILEELNLTDIDIVKEEDFPDTSRSMVQPYGFVSAGGIGFESFTRDKTYFKAQPHVINSIPFTTIGQIAGYVTGYSIIPDTNSYARMFHRYYSATNVSYGQTKVLDMLAVAHYGKSAKMVMDGVVVDGDESTIVSNTIVSKADGTFTN